MEWEPIETAPRDETWIILWFDQEEPCVRSGFWSEEYKDWYDSEASGNSLTTFYDQPTHWAPLQRPTSLKG